MLPLREVGCGLIALRRTDGWARAIARAKAGRNGGLHERHQLPDSHCAPDPGVNAKSRAIRGE